MENGNAYTDSVDKIHVLSSPNSEQGFTYLALLITVALLGVSLAATGTVWHFAMQREKERELLFVGKQFRQAIAEYYVATPGKVKKYPLELEDLLRDTRFPGVKRYLRKIYVDPMTGTQEWGLIQAPDGGILGVFSLSEDAPIRTSFAARADELFVGKAKYREWKFFYLPGQVLSLPNGAR